MNPARTRPARALAAIPPGAWRNSDEMIKGKGRKGNPSWPDWCLLPMAGWQVCAGVDIGYSNLPDDYSVFQESLKRLEASTRMMAIGSWRYCQSAYYFHPALLEELLADSGEDKIPVAAIMRLPECCPYIATPGFSFAAGSVYGMYAQLDYDIKSGGSELVMTLDMDSGTFLPIRIPLRFPTLRESVLAIVRQSDKVAQLYGMALPAEQSAEVDAEIVSVAQRLMPVVLYLCTDKPELDSDQVRKGNSSSLRTPPKAKTGPLVPAKPRVWTVGRTIGRAIKAAHAAAAPTGGRKSPHLRRGHWHGYWTGPRDGERRLDVQWTPPVFVGETSQIKRPVNGDRQL